MKNRERHEKGKDEAKEYQRESDTQRACEEVCALCKPQVVLVVLDRSITRGTTAAA